MNWLEKTQDTPLDELVEEDNAASASIAPAAEGEVAKSIVCNDCGKKFRSQELAGFHAEKTGHDDFAESAEAIAPLTEEEKKNRLEEMRARLAEKRAKQSEIDKIEAKKNEKIREKATKETQDAKEELQRKEKLKEVAKKRQEQRDDAEAKKRIKAQIEADKAERRRKAEEAKAAREGRPAPSPDAGPTPAPAPPTTRTAATHNEARLRLQLSSGNVMKTLPADTTLFEVAQMLETEKSITVNKFVMTFPKKTFEGSLDFGKTLKEAGLVPSAVLIVQ
jgi:UBX domain-containing protein 1/4